MEKKAKKILKENGQDYCRNTTLHGFSYWVLEGIRRNRSTSLALRLSPSSDSSIFDKIFWVVVVVAMIIWGVEMVTEAFIDWANDPTRKYERERKVGFLQVAIKLESNNKFRGHN